MNSESQTKLETENREILHKNLKIVEDGKIKLQEDQKKFDEIKKRANDIFQQKLIQETAKIHEEAKQKIRAETDGQILKLKENAEAAELQIRNLKEKELEALTLKNEVIDLKRNFNIEKDKYLQVNK